MVSTMRGSGSMGHDEQWSGPCQRLSRLQHHDSEYVDLTAMISMQCTPFLYHGVYLTSANIRIPAYFAGQLVDGERSCFFLPQPNIVANKISLHYMTIE